MTNSFLVYLAGPITGQSYAGATDWRTSATDMLHLLSKGDIRCLDPMRNKAYLNNELNIGDHYDEHIMSSQRGIFGRDRFDCMRADLVLVNMLGATRVSIGTVMEIAWANSRNIPVVLAMEKEGNPHEHAMLREACYWRTDDLPDAVLTVAKILCPKIGDSGKKTSMMTMVKNMTRTEV